MDKAATAKLGVGRAYAFLSPPERRRKGERARPEHLVYHCSFHGVEVEPAKVAS
jgi:hypothetical protein